MKILLSFMVFILGLIQVSNSVEFSSSNEVFANPERGFYRYTATSSVAYSPLDLRTLRQYIEKHKA